MLRDDTLASSERAAFFLRRQIRLPPLAEARYDRRFFTD